MIEDKLEGCPNCHGSNVAVNSVLREHFVACLNPACMHCGPINASRPMAVALWNAISVDTRDAMRE
jgi:hypothetical protein